MTRPFDKNDFPSKFGKRLRDARHAAGMSQLVLAEKAGYVHQTISNIERGLTSPSIGAIIVIAEVLGVHPQVLLFGNEE